MQYNLYWINSEIYLSRKISYVELMMLFEVFSKPWYPLNIYVFEVLFGGLL